MLRFSCAGRSHPGLRRDSNEDAGFAGPYLQLVADGVGGAAAGEVAAATAAYVASAVAASVAGSDPVRVLTRAVELIDEQLRIGTETVPARSGMGTTLTALLLDDDRCALVQVGDSRAYVFRDDELTQVTRDQTYVQTLVEEGLVTRDEARTHPLRNVVLQALDGTGLTAPDITLLDLGVDDRVLVCSDGLTDLVDDDEVARHLRRSRPDAVADALVQAALEAGGRDNVTCLVADVVDAPRLVPDGAMLGALADPTLVVDPAAVHASSI